MTPGVDVALKVIGAGRVRPRPVIHSTSSLRSFPLELIIVELPEVELHTGLVAPNRRPAVPTRIRRQLTGSLGPGDKATSVFNPIQDREVARQGAFALTRLLAKIYPSSWIDPASRCCGRLAAFVLLGRLTVFPLLGTE